MVKHSQTIRQQIADELLECVWPFCEIGAKRVNTLCILSNSLAMQSSALLVNTGNKNGRKASW